MTSMMSMEDLFYGPREPTWILPTRNEAPPRVFREPPPVYHERRPLTPERHRPIIYNQHPKVQTIPVLAPELHRPVVYSQHPKVQTVPEGPVRIVDEVRQVVGDRVPLVIKKETNKPKMVGKPLIIRPPPIELKVPMCCEKCATKVKDRLLGLEGVESVIADQYNQKVIVTGNVDPARVLSQVKLVKKKSAFWDMTVDYSQAYHKMRRDREMALAAEQAARKDEAAKASAAPAAGPNVVVKLPKEENGPNVTVVLPPEPTVKVPAKEKGPNVTVVLPDSEAKENRVPYQASWGTQRQRYASPPKGYRQEFYYGPREEYYRGYDERPSAFRGPFYERPHGFQGEFPAPRPEHFSPYRNY